MEQKDCDVTDTVASIVRQTAICCHEALKGYWDYELYPDGFDAMREECERALRLMGKEMPDYAARDAEQGEEETDNQ